MRLEDEADRRRAVLGRVAAVERHSIDDDRPGVGTVEGADQVEQRALAAPRRPGQRRELARLELERRLVQRADPTAVERLADAVDDDPRAAAQRGWTQ